MRHLLVVTITFVITSAPAVKATTCIQRAEECSKKGLGFVCFENSRMAKCAVAENYLSPDGKVYEASGVFSKVIDTVKLKAQKRTKSK